MCELNLTEKARNVEIENDCSCVYTAIGPEGMAFYQHIDIVLAFCRSLNIIISCLQNRCYLNWIPFIFLKPLDEMSPRLVGVNYRDHLLMLI